MKRTILVISPLDTYSGYGARSRDIAKILYEQTNEYDIKFYNTPWGKTRTGAIGLLPDNIQQWVNSNTIDSNWLNINTCDLCIQITVPNEFQNIGKFGSIGITAGIESTLMPLNWIEGCNRMNIVLFSSEFSRQVAIGSKYEVIKQNPDLTKATSVIELTCNSDVLTEYVDFSIFNKKVTTSDVTKQINKIPENFIFLTVGHWLSGEFNEDRKNISGTIAVFLDTFKGHKSPPALLIKVNSGVSNEIFNMSVQEKVDYIKSLIPKQYKLPNIYMIDGDLSDIEMNELYNHPKIKCMYLLTKGEGFGRPFAEFAVTGKPIICSGWSAHTEFLDNQTTLMVGGELTHIHPSAANDMLLREAKWFTHNNNEAMTMLDLVFNQYDSVLTRSRKTTNQIKNKLTFEQTKSQLMSHIHKLLPKTINI